MDLIVLTDCLYCDRLSDGTGYECDSVSRSCYAMEWYSKRELLNYWRTGICRYYNKSHSVTLRGGTAIKEG